MLTTRQQHCLNGLGITVWQTRRSAVTQTERPVSIPDIPTIQKEPEPEKTTLKPAAELLKQQIFPLQDWPQTLDAIQACANCTLAQSCTRKVPGKGSKQAQLMIVGEAPGHDEDQQGIPFVGRAGQLLDKILQAIQLDQDSVYITNILKCRPPNNRDPHADEIQACAPFLQAQIKLIQPKVILLVGRISAQNLLKDQSPLGKLRGKNYLLPDTEIPVMVTYHPAYLLRNPAEKAKVWEDMKALHRLLAAQHAED